MHEFTYITAFTVGLMGGVHCVGMCGGIISALTFASENDKNSHDNARLHLLLGYNLGRILSYTIMGSLLGGLGWLVSVWSNIHVLQIVLQFIAAIFMLSMGLYISGWWMGLTKIEKLGVFFWQFIQPVAQKLLPVKTPVQAITLGLLWGWLPCGLVYSVLVWSVSTASFQQGALLMLSFGLGTLPNLLAMGVFANQLKQFVQIKSVRRFAGSVVILFALWSLYLVY
ncbi:Heavy-metal-associated domain (N-terminus) and membrane-bounded cytochrome biogenesis cycZ-like domain, possible membrane copper tolerance protein [hydrothermal vent metagenome]|uniref:Heavy-metal-associated domain (N-terminus) and membrane-bounded cytochrome biogenesis cycZ-like domain, possible membrane copper tolerance protein n=1 Tax=hydrothermal vent metagenome TaxID=652676 RepID=A0A3B0WLY6_9ZZZZ